MSKRLDILEADVEKGEALRKSASRAIQVHLRLVAGFVGQSARWWHFVAPWLMALCPRAHDACVCRFLTRLVCCFLYRAGLTTRYHPAGLATQNCKNIDLRIE